MSTSLANRRPTWLAVIAGLAFVLGFLNFVWFFAESSTIGDANRGFVRDGRYFLVNAGVATEVPKAAWDWSVFHGRSIFVTHPLAILGGMYVAITVAFPAMLGAVPDPARHGRLASIVSSGPRLFTARTGGRLGGVQLTRPLVRVDIHPGGLILWPFGLGQFPIEAARLVAVVEERSRLSGTRFRIAHTQVGTPPLVELYVDGDAPILAAIRGLIPAREGRPVDPPPALTADLQDVPYSTGMKVMIVTGLVMSLIFLAAVLASGFAWRIGPFGIVWIAALVAIVGYNAWRSFVRDRRRW